MRRVLVVSKDKEPALVIKEALKDTAQVEIEENEDIAIGKFKKKRYDLTFIETKVLMGLTTSEEKPIAEALRFLKKFHPKAPIITFSDITLSRKTVQAVKLGAADYLFTPLCNFITFGTPWVSKIG